VARASVGRDLFATPEAGVVIGNVDVYDVFPYVEARYVQIVTDPVWNRLVVGELGRSLRAFDGGGTPSGPLREPRGIAVDAANRVYVADSGNDRVLVFRADTEFDAIDLVPLYEIAGLRRPHDVALSDGGTPFDPSDDRLYVAETGGNRVVAFALPADGASELCTLGELGSGPNRFAGPLAIAVGRSDGTSTSDVYVADAHNRRLVRLQDGDHGLTWASSIPIDADAVSSLDTDNWGNVYAAVPGDGSIRKFNAALEPVAELREPGSHPRDFHVPMVSLRDHRDGSVHRTAHPAGVIVEEWTDGSGVRLVNLGVELHDLSLEASDAVSASFLLTDRASVTAEVRRLDSGRVVQSHDAGTLGAGRHRVDLAGDGLAPELEGDYVLRLTARSSYGLDEGDVLQATFSLGPGGTRFVPGRPMLLGTYPNPFVPATRIAYAVPDGDVHRTVLRIFDARGRLVRAFGRENEAPGFHELVWDGTDEAGKPVSAGVYFYTLRLGESTFDGKLVRVR
jgi:hypothetical protein